MADRYVLLGLAHARSPWFRDVGRWANAAAIPADFVKCLTAEEVRTRLSTGRSFSALLIDGSLPGADRDLLDAATDTGAAVLVVDDRRVNRDWLALGASRILPSDFTRADLLDALEHAARPISRADSLTLGPSPEATEEPSWSGRLIAVTGPGGTGASLTAMALSQGLASDPRFRHLVLLADLALNAEQAVLHDARDVVPGVQELTEAFRTGIPNAAEVRSLVFSTDRGDYHLLLGLRRHRDWASLRPRAFEAALAGLLHSYRLVVADIDPDLEGESDCGVMEIEDRNLLARTVSRRAALNVIVGNPGVKGLHSLVRQVTAMLEFGVDTNSVLPVINRAPRNARQRAEMTAGFTDLLDSERRGLASPVFVTERRRVDEALRDGTPLPAGIGTEVARAAMALLDRQQPTPTPAPAVEPEPVAIAPGSLGSFTDLDDEAD